MIVSECCGAPIIYSDICSQCRNHTGTVCEECGEEVDDFCEECDNQIDQFADSE